jgi:large subunit ribosomal protein L21
VVLWYKPSYHKEEYKIMYAILETGSKQYKVEEGDVLEVELLEQDKISEDNTVNFDSVLLVKDTDLLIGQPFVADAWIQAKVLEEFKAPKVIIFKKKSKKQFRRTRGHRQILHRIQIEKIGVAGAMEAKQDSEEAQPEPDSQQETKTPAKAKKQPAEKKEKE